MDYYGNNDWRDYLAHYGVKGMKWRKHRYLRTDGNGHYEYNLPGGGTIRYGTDNYETNRLGYKTTGKYITTGKMNQNRLVFTKSTNDRRRENTYTGFTTLGASEKTRSKKLGRLTVTRDEDGTTLSYTKKRKKTAADALQNAISKVGQASRRKAAYRASARKSSKKITDAVTKALSRTISKPSKPITKRKKKVTYRGKGIKRTGVYSTIT